MIRKPMTLNFVQRLPTRASSSNRIAPWFDASLREYGMSCHNDEGRVEKLRVRSRLNRLCTENTSHENHKSHERWSILIENMKMKILNKKRFCSRSPGFSMVHFILQRRLLPHTSTKNIQKPKAMQNGKQRIRRGAILSLCLSDYFSYPSWVRRVGLFCPLLVFEPP